MLIRINAGLTLIDFNLNKLSRSVRDEYNGTWKFSIKEENITFV